MAGPRRTRDQRLGARRPQAKGGAAQVRSPRPVAGAAGAAARGASEYLTGPNAVLAVLAGRRRVLRVLVAEGVRPGTREELAAACERRGVALVVVPRRELDERVGHSDHQGAAAEAGHYPYVDEATILDRIAQADEPALVVVADSVQDPHNLGSLARTAEVVGVHGLIIPEHRATGVTPAVVRASAGAVELLPVARVTNVARSLERLKAAGLWTAGLEADGELVYDEADLTLPLALVVGGEERGLSRVVRAACDFTVRLPMRGQTGSLNLGVAAAVVLYEAWRQRRRLRSAAR